MRLRGCFITGDGIFSNRQSNLLLSLFFLGSNVGYFLVGRWPHPFFGLWAAVTLQFLLFGVIVARARRGEWLSLPLIILTGAVSRGILWFSDPILENDYWRYLWDGRVLAHGINPYLYAPLDPALDSIGTTYRSWIGWGRFGTIYPPVAEILFAATHLVAGDSILGLKIMLTAFDFGIGMILIGLLSARGQDRRWVMLYLLNPLVLKEIANSAHLDSIPVFFTMAAIYWMMGARSKGVAPAWGCLALATGAKLYPVVLLPLFIRVDQKWKRGLAVFMAVLAGLYLPFLSAGLGLFGGTGAYAKYWIFNAGIFKVTTLALNSFLGIFEKAYPLELIPLFREALKNDYPAKAFLGILFCGGMIWRARKLTRPQDLPVASLWVLGLLLIVSPVVDAWYVLWVLPLACLLRSGPWLVFSYLVIASYAWFYAKDVAPYYRALEYGGFFALMLLYHFRYRLNRGKQSPDPSLL